MIGVRSIVRFISKHKDKDKLIVREIHADGKVLIESTRVSGSLYLVPVVDIKECEG